MTSAPPTSTPTVTTSLVVLQSVPEPRPTTNPYVVMLRDALAAVPGVTVLSFSWRRALRADYDVFHVHWPEILVSGRTRLRRTARQAMFVAFMLRLRRRGVPIVRTVHNLELPSGISRVEVALLRWLERRTTDRIVLNDVTPLPPGTPSALIPHGHYRPWFASYEPAPAVPGRIGYFGLVRRYKGVVDLVAAFRDVATTDATLSVAGRPSGPDLVAEIEAAAAGDERIELTFGFLDDAALVAQVSSSALVALPYRHMHNSGGALTALSLDRPVLLPANEVNRALREEVGPDWVHLYDGPLTAAHLEEALAATAGLTGRPDLSAREWDEAGRAHRDAFAAALARAAGEPVG